MWATLSALYFLGVMGFLFFFPPLIVIAFKLWFRVGCHKAFGKAVRIERNYDPESESTLIQTVIAFTDFRGQRVEVKTGTGYGMKYIPRMGQTVKVYYRPETLPVKFQVASRGLWEVSALLMATGLSLMLPVVLYYFLKH